MKIINDKYYTPILLAYRLIDVAHQIIDFGNVEEVIEPSAGNGSFYHAFFKGYHYRNIPIKAYDIDPQGEGIEQQDFLTLELGYKKGRLFLGNPPFGDRNALSLKFFKKCIHYGDYIAFIQPISQMGNNDTMYEFDTIHEEDLGVVDYSGVSLHCCFKVWGRPQGGRLNPKPNYKLRDVIIKEYRRNGTYKKPQEGWDIAICTWGDGSLGKSVEFVGQYAQEAYLYVINKDVLEKVKELMALDNIRNHVNSISAKRISVSGIYKYLLKNGIK